MIRKGTMLAILAMLSATTLWAQAVTDDRAAAERQKAEASAAKARADAAARRTEELRLSLQTPPRPGTTQAPYSKVEIYNEGVYKLVTPSGSTDPLAALQVAPGTWWNNVDTAATLNLTKDQQRKMDDIFQQFRLKLIDLNAALSKEELIMDPLIAAERLDEMKIVTQIDRIAQARAELEKANSRMLLAIRQSLTMEQWSKIQSTTGGIRTRVLKK